jgi:hypothetical protein
MTRTSALMRALIVGATVWSAACTGRDAVPGDSVAAGPARDSASLSGGGGPAGGHDFAAIVDAAKSAEYTYEAVPRVPVTASVPDSIKHNGVAQGNAPTMVIAKATRKSTPTPLTELVLARVNSDKAYPELGILPHDNYIWRYRADPDSTKWEVWMIPEQAPRAAKRLTRTVELSGGHYTLPRIVRAEKTNVAVLSIAFGACVEDPACPSGHCGYQ